MAGSAFAGQVAIVTGAAAALSEAEWDRVLDVNGGMWCD